VSCATARHLGYLQQEGCPFGQVARTTALGLPVPACPGFDVADLVWDLVVVHNFWTQVVTHQLTAPDQSDSPIMPNKEVALAPVYAPISMHIRNRQSRRS
jgi:hypothetical protein